MKAGPAANHTREEGSGCLAGWPAGFHHLLPVKQSSSLQGNGLVNPRAGAGTGWGGTGDQEEEGSQTLMEQEVHQVCLYLLTADRGGLMEPPCRG